MASLKSEVDELELDRLKTVHVHLSKLSHVVKNNVAKKIVCDEFVKKCQYYWCC